MAEIIKFVYIMILCVSLLLIVEAGGSKLILISFYLIHNLLIIFSNLSLFLFYIIEECVTDIDCEKLYPGNKKPLICNVGYCYSLYKGKFYLSIISKTFFFDCYNVVTLITCLKLTYISLLLKFL